MPDGVGNGQCKILSGVSGTGFYSECSGHHPPVAVWRIGW